MNILSPEEKELLYDLRNGKKCSFFDLSIPCEKLKDKGFVQVNSQGLLELTAQGQQVVAGG